MSTSTMRSFLFAALLLTAVMVEFYGAGQAKENSGTSASRSSANTYKGNTNQAFPSPTKDSPNPEQNALFEAIKNNTSSKEARDALITAVQADRKILFDNILKKIEWNGEIDSAILSYLSETDATNEQNKINKEIKNKSYSHFQKEQPDGLERILEKAARLAIGINTAVDEDEYGRKVIYKRFSAYNTSSSEKLRKDIILYMQSLQSQQNTLTGHENDNHYHKTRMKEEPEVNILMENINRLTAHSQQSENFLNVFAAMLYCIIAVLSFIVLYLYLGIPNKNKSSENIENFKSECSNYCLDLIKTIEKNYISSANKLESRIARLEENENTIILKNKYEENLESPAKSQKSTIEPHGQVLLNQYVAQDSDINLPTFCGGLNLLPTQIAVAVPLDQRIIYDYNQSINYNPILSNFDFRAFCKKFNTLNIILDNTKDEVEWVVVQGDESEFLFWGIQDSEAVYIVPAGHLIEKIYSTMRNGELVAKREWQPAFDWKSANHKSLIKPALGMIIKGTNRILLKEKGSLFLSYNKA